MADKLLSKDELHKIFHPVTEFRLRDILQIITGSSLIAIPVGFTEEAWALAGTLPILNTIGFFILSLVFISLFSYYHYHGHLTEKKWPEFFKRIFATYIFSFIIVALLLFLIQKAPWQTDFIVALKMVILVTFPASLGGALVDTLK
jgi:uncharacterized membrane protein